MNRREIIKRLSVLPLAGSFLPIESIMGAPSGPLGSGENIYKSIGVDPVINCVGTYTIIGGSIERPEVVQAMHDASGFFVQYDELAFGIGRRLAEITGAEWGMVSAGCAAGMKHVAAACVTGGNPEKLIRIPNLTGFDKTEVVSLRNSRNSYDHSIRNIGVKMITVTNLEELGKSLNSHTALIYLTAGGAKDGMLTAVAELAKPLNIPILVDAAAEDLTIPNVHLQRGATIVAYSGGKAICGPQCAGLLLGRKDILMSAWQASSPHHGPGRDNKVGKEEMIGMLAAVEAWVKRDHVEKMNIWRGYLNLISKKVSTINSVKCDIQEPKGLSNHSPSLIISWDPDKFNITGPEVAEDLATKQPRIAVHSDDINDSGNTNITVVSGQMQPGNDKIVADRIFEVLSKKHPKIQPLAAPAANITGRWKVNIEFYSSKSQHTITIEQQEGNYLSGTHKGDFSTRDMVGIIDGDQIKLFSEEKPVADYISFTFFGSVSTDKMSGQIYMGEYIKASFTASKHIQPPSQKPIYIPKGQPLAT